MVNADAHPSLLRVLRQGTWFANLPVPLQEAIVRGSVVRSYAKGQVLSLEDSPPKGLFVVLDGRVRVVRTLPGGEEALYHIGEPGFWVGELPLIAMRKTVVSIISDTAARAMVLPKSQFERIVEAEPRYLRHFVLLLADRYATLLQMLAHAHGLAPMDRLRARLAETVDLKHRDRIASEPPSLNISQSELAIMIGVSRQKLNSLLKELEAAGLVELGFRRIRVPNPARLRAASDQGHAPAEQRASR
jgi:CRP/FNR family transcriptional regulator, cyclic AMP receptor protein